MKIKELPLDVRPREKALKYGFESLSDSELIAIILGSGTKEANAIQLSENLLSDIGGLNGLMRSNYQSLIKISGIKNAKALRLTSLITIFQRVDLTEHTYLDFSIKQILEKYHKRLQVDRQEKVVLVILDRNRVIIKESIIASGADSSVHISYRDVFKEIYINNGYSFYLIHTHPNDIAYPSKEDMRVTRIIANKCKRIGLSFLDHYVIGTDGATSIDDFLKKK